MELLPVVSTVGKLVLGKLPPFLLKRYYTQERMARLVYIDLLPQNQSAWLNLGPAAEFRVAMQVINLLPFPVELDRALIRLSCGTSPLESLNVERRWFQSGEIGAVTFAGNIPDGHAQQIAQNQGSAAGGLDGLFEFNSRVQQFKRVIPHLSGVAYSLANAHLRK